MNKFSFLDSWENGHLMRWCGRSFGEDYAFQAYRQIVNYLFRHNDDLEYLLNLGWPSVYEAVRFEEEN